MKADAWSRKAADRVAWRSTAVKSEDLTIYPTLSTELLGGVEHRFVLSRKAEQSIGTEKHSFLRTLLLHRGTTGLDKVSR